VSRVSCASGFRLGNPGPRAFLQAHSMTTLLCLVLLPIALLPMTTLHAQCLAPDKRSANR
jgi:hypothetical protein